MESRIRLGDFIKVTRVRDAGKGVRRVATFPELVRAEDGTYRGVIDPETGEEIECPYESYLIALIQWGYENLKNNRVLLPGRRFEPPEEGPTGFFPRRDLRHACRPRKGLSGAFYFPTLSATHRGYAPLIGGDDPYIACYIKAIQTGVNIKHWDNGIPDILPDDTEERVSTLNFLLEDLPKTVKDSGWQLNARSNPRRGYRLWDRYVAFEHDLTETQLHLLKERILLTDCPGLGVGVSPSEVRAASFHFTTSLDSSD